MIELAHLLWQFLMAQSPAVWLTLVPWHLLTVITVLAVLGVFGLHFLVGHLAGFYYRKGRLRRWISIPSLLVILISLNMLLGAYLLGVHAPRLVSINLTNRVVQTLGAHLLEPAFSSPALSGAQGGEIPKSRLKDALKGFTENQYRDALAKRIVAPKNIALPPTSSDGKRSHKSTVIAEIALVQVGLRWITSPHETWWAPLNPGAIEKPATGKKETKDAFFLPSIMTGLIRELPDQETLSRSNWENITGTRFIESYLQPVMGEYLAYMAITSALVVLLLNLLFFLVLRRVKRVGIPRPGPAKTVGEDGKGAAKTETPPPAPIVSRDVAVGSIVGGKAGAGSVAGSEAITKIPQEDSASDGAGSIAAGPSDQISASDKEMSSTPAVVPKK